jgi:hypothetical protein
MEEIGKEEVMEVELPGNYRLELPARPKKEVISCINEDEFYGFDMPANGGAYGAARRMRATKLETKRALVTDAICTQIAESCIEKGRALYTGRGKEIPEETVFEASFVLPGLPPCRVIVAYTTDAPLQLVKTYPDFRGKRLVYVYVGNCGPYA